MPQTKTENKIWDVVVIGGGPAGMMAAGRASECGKKVLLLEKNSDLGKKLLITGGGRCNLTNNKPNNRTLLAKYKGNDQFLFSAFSQFSVKDTLSFFNGKGMLTKEENEGRIFPVSDSSKSVYDVLYEYMKSNNVSIHKGTNVKGLDIDKNNGNILISTASGNIMHAKSCVLATGGTSRPETGSTGEGFLWLKKLKHTIIESDVSLVPIILKDDWTKKASGTTLEDIKLTTFQNYKGKITKQESYKGKVLFTHLGISGPTVLNMSKDIRELLKYGEVTIMLDLFPNRDNRGIKQDLQNILVNESNKKIKNVLGSLMPSSMQSGILKLVNINGDTFCHSVSSEDRIKLAEIMKAVPLNVKGLMGKDKAIISSGGVMLTEVDFKTMQSRIIPNLYLVGDVLNIDRPSGGYSLQLCWTTGYIAGSNA